VSPRTATCPSKAGALCRVALLEYLLHTKVRGKPVSEYPSVRQLADCEFDDSCLTHLWQQARTLCPGKECAGYYFSLDDQGDFDGSLRQPAFFVLTIDGKIALVSTGSTPW